ncbi:hypothetical protein PZA11_000791 [Diplocarpon coronariae]
MNRTVFRQIDLTTRAAATYRGSFVSRHVSIFRSRPALRYVHSESNDGLRILSEKDKILEPVVPWWNAFSREEEEKERQKRVEKAKKAKSAKKARNARMTPQDRQNRHAKRKLRKDLKYMEEKLSTLMPKDGMLQRIMNMQLQHMSVMTAAAQNIKWAEEKKKRLKDTAKILEERKKQSGEASTELSRSYHADIETAKQDLAVMVLKARIAQNLPNPEPKKKWKIDIDKATMFSADDPYLEKSQALPGAIELDHQAVSENEQHEKEANSLQHLTKEQREDYAEKEANSLQHLTKEQREDYAEKEAKLLRFFTKAQKAEYAELMAMRQHNMDNSVMNLYSEGPEFFVSQKLKQSGAPDTSTSGGPPTTHVEYGPTGPSAAISKNSSPAKPRQRQITINCHSPEMMTREHLFSALGSFVLDQDQWVEWVKYNGPQALVFLFTPSLATMVENDTALVPDLLKKITIQVMSKGAPFETDVVCACVDGLSPPPEMLGHSVRGRTAEGFSFLHGPLLGTVNEIWDQAERGLSASPSMQSSLTFCNQPSGPPEVTLPLANTLFKTGRRSTLLASRWRYDPTKEDFTAIKSPEDRSNMSIQLLNDMKTALPEVYIPAIPLTPARAIKNGLGNIVSKLDFGEEDAGPASRELEITVTEFLNELRAGKSTVDVWALVVPSKSVSGAADGDQKLLLDVSEVRQKWVSPPNAKMEFGYVGYWIGKGATFSRVLSGGGGWGAKQGLLSLDPQTTYAEIPEARFDFSGGSLEEQQASALGNLAQEGAHIQFFVAHNKRPLADMEDLGRAKMMRTSTVFGSVPSTVDDVYPAQSANSPRSTEQPVYHIRRGHFGFVSESGMFVRHSTVKSDIMSMGDAPSAGESVTKIDLPYSYLVRDFSRSGRERRKYKELPGTVLGKVKSLPIRKLPT